MTARLDDPRERLRFYLGVDGIVLAWVALSLVLGAALHIPPIAHFLITMAGIGAVLYFSLRSPAYKRIKSGHHYSEKT